MFLTVLAAFSLLVSPVLAASEDLGKPVAIAVDGDISTDFEAASALAPESVTRPKRRDGDIVPVARWDHRPAGRIWTRAAMSALLDHGKPILQTVPRDIADWCPAYPNADEKTRAAFWVGFMSALAKHESTYRQDAVGGGGRWYGLLQILPATARGYKCASPSREGLKHGPSNLSCAIRILTVVMPRDKVMASKDKRWRGVAADWGPMRIGSKRKDIAGWTRKQSYCRELSSVRPKARPIN
ncbi:transglycosylase SLT domain-containing protein [Planktotalea sp.]|uniref:transglycosylase SLT domain-containing protein n=1 Tax=Planktotalea sp. TaxID=2029877 RepID=UPI003D6B4000